MTSQIDALVVGQEAMNARLDALEAKFCPTIARTAQSDLSPPTPPPTQPNSLAKKKRNQKTRQQHKRKQALRVTVQEVEHTYGQEVDSLRISVGKVASKPEAFVKSVTWFGISATSWHAVISYVGMTLFDGMIMVQNGVIGMSRMGVG